MAARRSSSKNNLKQLGLALHNYHDVYRQFPTGTIVDDKLKPDQRLSWIVSILPFIEEKAVYDRIERKKGWKDAANRRMMQTRMMVLQNPGVAVKKEPSYGSTHYVGIAGLGKDSLTAKVHNKKTGIFGYDRVTRMRDIRDGTSNTMMASEASANYGPWGSGGTATIRAFTKKPYINGPDGIGGPFPGGCNVLFADGSVKFISNNISVKVLEALSTAQGGETVGGF
jgi:prepilin-type processing-associated H-X9-DG protein